MWLLQGLLAVRLATTTRHPTTARHAKLLPSKCALCCFFGAPGPQSSLRPCHPRHTGTGPHRQRCFEQCHRTWWHTQRAHPEVNTQHIPTTATWTCEPGVEPCRGNMLHHNRHTTAVTCQLSIPPLNHAALILSLCARPVSPAQGKKRLSAKHKSNIHLQPLATGQQCYVLHHQPSASHLMMRSSMAFTSRRWM